MRRIDELLLVVFLAEDGQIGADDLEKLEDDRGDAPKMPGAAGPFENVGETGHLDERRRMAREGKRSARSG